MGGLKSFNVIRVSFAGVRSNRLIVEYHGSPSKEKRSSQKSSLVHLSREAISRNDGYTLRFSAGSCLI